MFGVSVGARTRTEGVGGLYGIQFHHGHEFFGKHVSQIFYHYSTTVKKMLCIFAEIW